MPSKEIQSVKNYWDGMASVKEPPTTPVATEDQVVLVYELHLTNFAAESLSVKRLHISDSDTSKEPASFAESSLRNAYETEGR